MAMDPTTYLLDFDMESFQRQMSEITEAYTLLTDSFANDIDSVDSKLQNLDSKIMKISTTLDASTAKMDSFYLKFHNNLETTSKMFKDVNEHALKLNSTLGDIGGFDPTEAPKAGNLTPAKGAAFQVTATGTNDEELEESMALAEATLKRAREASKATKEAEATWKKTSKKIADTLKKDMKAAVAKVKGLMNSFSMGALAGGGLMAMVGLIVLGTQEKQRKGAERGEMRNVFEGMGDLFESSTKRAVRKWSNFQEKAQWHWGIGRKEIQTTLATIRNAGFKDAVDKNLTSPMKMAEENAAAASIQLDKFLNIATGTSAKQAVEMSENLGYTFKSSMDQLTKLRAEAKRSGMDFEKFTGAVLSGSSAMQQYRVDVGEVAEVMRKVKKHYEGLGMSDQQAGAMASKVVGQMAQFNLQESQEMKFFQQYYANQGISLDGVDARIRGREEYTKGGEESSKILIKMAQFTRDQAMSRTSSRSKQIDYLMRGHGMTQEQAATTIDVAGDFSDDTSLPELTKGQNKELKNAFKSEGAKLTELQKNQRELIAGLAKMGEGLLSIVANILAVLIMGIRSLPATLSSAWAMLFGTDKEKDLAKSNMIRIASLQDKFFANIDTGIDEVIKGWSLTQKAIGSTLDTLGFGAMKTAVTADVGPTTWSGIPAKVAEAVDDAMLGYKMEALDAQHAIDRKLDAMQEAIGLITTDELQKRDTHRMNVSDDVISMAKLRQLNPDASDSAIETGSALLDHAAARGNKLMPKHLKELKDLNLKTGRAPIQPYIISSKQTFNAVKHGEEEIAGDSH